MNSSCVCAHRAAHPVKSLLLQIVAKSMMSTYVSSQIGIVYLSYLIRNAQKRRTYEGHGSLIVLCFQHSKVKPLTPATGRSHHSFWLHFFPSDRQFDSYLMRLFSALLALLSAPSLHLSVDGTSLSYVQPGGSQQGQ